jgi:hypothetical protein
MEVDVMRGDPVLRLEASASLNPPWNVVPAAFSEIPSRPGTFEIRVLRPVDDDRWFFRVTASDS